MHYTRVRINIKSLSLLGALGCLLALLGCEPTIATRGDILDPDKLAEIKVGTSTREDVANKLGTPTEVSTFDDKIWYYVGRETKQYSFLDPETIKQSGVEIQFNDSGVVTAIDPLNPQLAENIEPASGSTPTYGRNDTFWKQLLGDVGHTMPGGMQPGQTTPGQTMPGGSLP